MSEYPATGDENTDIVDLVLALRREDTRLMLRLNLVEEIVNNDDWTWIAHQVAGNRKSMTGGRTLHYVDTRTHDGGKVRSLCGRAFDFNETLDLPYEANELCRHCMKKLQKRIVKDTLIPDAS